MMMETPVPPGPTAPRLAARTAGALWIVSVLAGVYAEVGVRGSMIVSGDAAATAARIASGQALYRLGFVADLVGDMAYMGLTVLLYLVLRPAGRTAALVSLAFGLAGGAAMAANLGNLFAPLILLRGAGSAAGLSPDLAAMVLAFVRLHSLGYSLSIALFSVQVAALGWLVLRCGFFPRIFGVLFLIEAACNLVSSFGGFLAVGWVQNLGGLILLPGLPAEGGFALWLLAVGLDVSRWRAVADPQRPA